MPKIDTDQLLAYKRLPKWKVDDIPQALLERHNTKVGTWGKLTILSGSLNLYFFDKQDRVLEKTTFDKNSDIPFVEPQVWHKIEAASDDLEFYLTFYCQKEDYFHKKYGMTKTHSEVIFSAPYLKENSKVLDLGCGQGRNSLYLTMLGHDVISVDANGQSLVQLENRAMEEELPSKIDWYDINSANLQDKYDFILSTVVFMFLDDQAVPDIIQDMQKHTNIGGYNLIVCAMDTTAYPCPMPFPFTFKEGELKEYYKDWEFIKYNENVGELHKTDANGNRLKMQFATMLAQKVR
ncbi:SAM-dependent methyltransferase TehB [Streptococcus caballi]|uniref:SAM-dependent methyltransferase TehB n=1 Tax=Streptococcus caballi TaxID=439220 RepID=UPI000381BC42|nr:SAM-dependent methyltransferase TehB [Streptococcus caballi]